MDLPCPFCGGKVDPEGWYRNDGVKGPECNGCGATAENMSLWNKREIVNLDEVFSLKRFDCETVGVYECRGEMVESHDGDWVSYEDIMKILKPIKSA